MAWVKQKFEVGTLSISLEGARVVLGNRGCDLAVWEPETHEDAHGMAMMLRRGARRLEEIGKGLP